MSNWLWLAEEPTTHKAYICYPYHDDPLKRSVELLILLIHIYPKAKKLFVPMTPTKGIGSSKKEAVEFALSQCKDLMKKCDFLLYCLRSEDTRIPQLSKIRPNKGISDSDAKDSDKRKHLLPSSVHVFFDKKHRFVLYEKPCSF